MSEPQGKSKVRLVTIPMFVAVFAAFVVFFKFVLVDTPSAFEDITLVIPVFIVMAVINVPLLWVRCTRCRLDYFSVYGIKQRGLFSTTVARWRFLFSKKCPGCGMERY